MHPLKGGVAVAADGIGIRRSLPHGHAVAVLGTLRAIDLDRPSPAALRKRAGKLTPRAARSTASKACCVISPPAR